MIQPSEMGEVVLAFSRANQAREDRMRQEYQDIRDAFYRRPECSRCYQESREAEQQEPVHVPTGFREVLASLSPARWVAGTGAWGAVIGLIIVWIMNI